MKEKEFTKPSSTTYLDTQVFSKFFGCGRKTNKTRDELESTEMLSFRCCRERCRLTSYLNKTSGRVKENVLTQSISVVRTRGAAFTLAEVLITLGIIGVVAAMTMPSLIASHKEKETVVKLKKFYSTMSNAFLLAENENTEAINWLTAGTGAGNAEIFFNKIKPYLSISKECGFEKGCFTDSYVKTLDGRNYLNYNNSTTEYHAVLSDGTQFIVYLAAAPSVPANPNDNVSYGNIKVDIDGDRGTHTFGKDVFIFKITKKGIMAEGFQDDSFKLTTHCNKSASSDANGRACTAWVVTNENMDYLHCNDLDWNTKTSCK